MKEVASNRRILGPDGKVKFVRYSSQQRTPVLRASRKGAIDPDVPLLSASGTATGRSRRSLLRHAPA